MNTDASAVSRVRRVIPRADSARKLVGSSNPAETADTTETTYYINVQYPCVGVLAYYAVLAYPKRSEIAKREAFFIAMKARRTKEYVQLIRGIRKGIPSIYTRLKNEKIEGAMRRGWARLVKRIKAGVCGWCVALNERSFLFDAPTPEGQAGFVLHGPNTVSKVMRALVDGVPGDPKEAAARASHRIWAESLPVLHLAMRNRVTVKIVRELMNSGGTSASKTSASRQINKELLDSTYDTDWLRESLEGAEELRLILGDRLGTDPHDRLGRGFRPESAIRLLPTETL